jgi:hypothetical protein
MRVGVPAGDGRTVDPGMRQISPRFMPKIPRSVNQECLELNQLTGNAGSHLEALASRHENQPMGVDSFFLSSQKKHNIGCINSTFMEPLIMQIEFQSILT